MTQNTFLQFLETKLHKEESKLISLEYGGTIHEAAILNRVELLRELIREVKNSDIGGG